MQKLTAEKLHMKRVRTREQFVPVVTTVGDDRTLEYVRTACNTLARTTEDLTGKLSFEDVSDADDTAIYLLRADPTPKDLELLTEIGKQYAAVADWLILNVMESRELSQALGAFDASYLAVSENDTTEAQHQIRLALRYIHAAVHRSGWHQPDPEADE